SIIDLVAQSEVRTIPTPSQGVMGYFFTPESGISGPLLTQFALSPNGNTIVLPARANARIELYDRATGTSLGSLPSAALPTAVDISEDSTTAVVSHEAQNHRITRVDLVAHTISGTFATTSDLSDQNIRITPDKSHAIASISNNVIFVDLTSGITDATLFTG